MKDSILVFDIETIPDLDGGRRLYNLAGLSDDEVAQAMAAKRQEARGTDSTSKARTGVNRETLRWSGSDHHGHRRSSR